jgi:phospholipid/cholesterol/gamma-HCH transport system substrate-binding protein
MHDEQTGANLKTTISNLESSSKKLDQNLEALQHSFLLRKYFKKEEKKNEKLKVESKK